MHASVSFILGFCSSLSPLPPENGQSSERAGNRCPDMRFSLMRIRNILIKTHNPPLNPSLQNHLHSPVLLHTAAVMAHSGPLFCLASSLTQGYVSLCLPSVSVIFDPLSLDFQTRRAKGPENSAFVCTSTLSPVRNGKLDICLMREEQDWDLPPGREIGRALCGVRAVTDTVKGRTFQALSMSVIMTSERVKITLKWDRWIKV